MKQLRVFWGSLLLFAMVSYSSTSYALALANTPLFLSNSSVPNVFFELDDSGSMDWSVLSKRYWHFCAYNRDGPGSTGSSYCGWEVTNGQIRIYDPVYGWRYLYYIYDNADNTYNDNCNGTAAAENCSGALASDWRIRNSDVNVLYYDPEELYEPWVGFPNASFTAARSDPEPNNYGYNRIRNLLNDFNGNPTGFVYEVWVDDRGFTGSRPNRGTNINATQTPNGWVDLWDKHIRYTVRTNDILVEEIRYTFEGYEGVPLPSGGRTGRFIPNVTTSTISGTQTDVYGRTITEIKQNIANWYQYYRRRNFVMKASVLAVIDERPFYRYGLSMINRYWQLFVEVPTDAESQSDPNHTVHNQDLMNKLTRFSDGNSWPGHGTPLRNGLKRTGEYFDNNDGRVDPIIDSCQQNFTLLFTDGYRNGSNPYIGNPDGDEYSNTLADVAKKYYDKDLSTKSNNVPTSTFDDASYQHMVTFTVAFGVFGTLVDLDGDGWPDPVLNSYDNWGVPTSSLGKIDDLWHAAYNSKGTFLAAQTPIEVVNGIAKALADIADRVSSAASVAQNTFTLGNNTQIYQSLFDSSNWSGQLQAFTVNTDGTIAGDPDWDARDHLENRTGHLIYTYSRTQGKGVRFKWGKLDNTQKNHLKTNPDSGTVESNQIGKYRLQYLKGKRSATIKSEAAALGLTVNFRERAYLLGDMIHSAPVFVGAPDRSYASADSSFPGRNAHVAFKTAHANRREMIYVGANDGMLHGFRVSNGRDDMSYIPNEVFAKLPELSSPNYFHRYYVDGSPKEGDVYVNGAWKTVIASGLRAGGQAVFVLDVTNPTNFANTDGAADNTVVMEFSDEDDADLGYTYAQPQIILMNNNKWAIAFGNGYNNTDADGSVSTTGNAVLFIVYLDGSGYIKIDTGVGSTSDPNGLSSVFPVDVDGDFRVDYLYGGDLEGNLWKFDVASSSDTSWKLDFSGATCATTSTCQPLFAAGSDQPITGRPVVGDHPTGEGLMVYFGTGKYIETSDSEVIGAATQTIYGIWDQSDISGISFSPASLSKSSLLEQTIDKETTSSFDTDDDGVDDATRYTRLTSDNQIDWRSSTNPSGDQGWYMDLQLGTTSEGERQVNDLVLRNGVLIFVTLTPSESPCEFGGSSWLMALDAQDGSRLGVSPFDFNGDKGFDGDDLVTDNAGNQVTASGAKTDTGITSTPSLIFISGDGHSSNRVDTILSGTGGLNNEIMNLGDSDLGRLMWREVK